MSYSKSSARSIVGSPLFSVPETIQIDQRFRFGFWKTRNIAAPSKGIPFSLIIVANASCDDLSGTAVVSS